MPEPITASLPKPEKPRSLVERVYVGTSKVVKGRYEHHLETVMKKVIPELSGLPEEIAAHMRPRLELAAHRAAVGRTTAEVVGVVAAFAGTVLLVKKAIDSRSPRAFHRIGVRTPLALPLQQLEKPIPIQDFGWTSHTNEAFSARIQAAASYHDEVTSRHLTTTPSPEARGMPQFQEVLNLFYTTPFRVEHVEAFGAIQKVGDWRKRFRDTLALRFADVFPFHVMDDPQKYENMKRCVLNAMEHVEDVSSTGFLNRKWLDEHAKRVAEFFAVPAY